MPTFRERWSRAGKRVPRRGSVWALGIAAVAIVLAATVWFYRWHLSRTALRVADPLVRAWVASQVLNASDSVYWVAVSPIHVEPARRRVMIDTITVTTDTVRNARLAHPHAVLTMRLRRCGVSGIDLTALASGAGLHALHAACDSAAMALRTMTIPADTGGPAPADSNNFLRFQGKIDLPAALPNIAVTMVELPHLHLALDLLEPDGRRTALAVDSVALRLDSIFINPAAPVTTRRPLFSRDITLHVKAFSRATEHGSLFTLRELDANLEDGSARLDGIALTPHHGPDHPDGITAVALRHVRLSRVGWRSLLLGGNILIGELDVDSIAMRSVSATRPRSTHPRRTPMPPLRTLIDVFGRGVALDSVMIHSTRMVQTTRPAGDSTILTVRSIVFGHLRFGLTPAEWTSSAPLGPVTVAVNGILRRTRRMNIAVARVRLDAGAQRLEIDSLRAAPEGNDSDWQRINPYRKARLTVAMAQIAMAGIDVPALMQQGVLHARMLAVHGMVIDVLKDKNKPEDPAPNIIRRSPQGVLHDAGARFRVDTLAADGLVTYRERAAGAAVPGILSFGHIRVHGSNFSTDPAHARQPFRLVGDARLMGVGALHVAWTVPLLANDFAMEWSGSLGTMNPQAMNGFLPDAVGMRFTGGIFEGATWKARVVRGLAEGELRPYWRDLHVELPGVARGDSGVVGGIVRGVAKLAANTFGIRGDNDSSGGHEPRTAPIHHQWIDIETLPQFIWFQLRDPLLAILKK